MPTVPHEPDEIGAAITRALAVLDARIARDRASTARDADGDRGAAGVGALDVLRKAADALKGQLGQLESPPAEQNPRSLE